METKNNCKNEAIMAEDDKKKTAGELTAEIVAEISEAIDAFYRENIPPPHISKWDVQITNRETREIKTDATICFPRLTKTGKNKLWRKIKKILRSGLDT